MIGSEALVGSHTENLKQFHIIDLNCNGSEDNVFLCSHNVIEQFSCSTNEDAFVICSGISGNYYNLAYLPLNFVRTKYNR